MNHIRALTLFTLREREVLDLLINGYPNRRIAQILVIKERTVRFHVENILRKLGVHSRMEVIALAIQNHWIKN